MRWSEAHDVYLCREVLSVKTYQFKSGSKESGHSWKTVSEDLNSITEVLFSTNQKSVRDRYRLLLDKHTKKMRQEESSSGTTVEESELDKLLQNIQEESEVYIAHYQQENEKTQLELNEQGRKVEAVRTLAMENLSDTRKRGELYIYRRVRS